jgi:L-rhamnonate dehydratase
VKIIDVRVVEIDFPRPDQERVAKLRRTGNANATADRAFPIALYSQFPRTSGKMPSGARSDFWLQIVAENGTWGLGLGSWGAPVRALIEQHYVPLLLNQDCFAIEFLNDIMWRAIQRHGDTGIAAVARSAVDLALWDLKGKLLGQPVYSLLGGPVRDHIVAYCTTEDLEWALELGFRHLKIGNPVYHTDGRAGLDRIEEKVASARAVVGPSAELMFNPVMSFNVAYALQVADRLRPYGVRWMQEPLMPWDVDGLAELKRAITWMELASGEDHHGRHVFRQLLQKRAVDVIQPDVLRCGGLTELMKIYHLAESFGVVTIPHTGANTPFGQHAAMAMPESPLAEYFLRSDPGVPLELTNGIAGTAVPQNGRIIPSDAPGFGIEVLAEWIHPLPSVANMDRG